MQGVMLTSSQLPGDLSPSVGVARHGTLTAAFLEQMRLQAAQTYSPINIVVTKSKSCPESPKRSETSHGSSPFSEPTAHSLSSPDLANPELSRSEGSTIRAVRPGNTLLLNVSAVELPNQTDTSQPDQTDDPTSRSTPERDIQLSAPCNLRQCPSTPKRDASQKIRQHESPQCPGAPKKMRRVLHFDDKDLSSVRRRLDIILGA